MLTQQASVYFQIHSVTQVILLPGKFDVSKMVMEKQYCAAQYGIVSIRPNIGEADNPFIKPSLDMNREIFSVDYPQIITLFYPHLTT